MTKKILLLSVFCIFSVKAIASPGPIAIDQWPSYSTEYCEYSGAATNFDAKIKLSTYFKRTKDLMSVRSVAQLTGRKFGITKTFFVEEETFFDAATGALVNLHRNEREQGCTFGGGECAINNWDDIKFVWGASQAENQLQTWRMIGDKPDAFAKRYPGFAKYWPVAMEGQPWFSDFYSSRPDARTDLDFHGYDSTLVPPLTWSFFLSRYMQEAKDKNFQVLVHLIDTNNKESAEIMPSVVSYDNSKADSTTLRSMIALGAIKSPAGRPSSIDVNKATKMITNIHFVVQHSMIGVVEGQISPLGCHQRFRRR